MDDDYLTVPEVAQQFRTSPGTVRYWRHVGTGPKSFRFGRRVLYRREDVAAWVAERIAADPHRDTA